VGKPPNVCKSKRGRQRHNNTEALVTERVEKYRRENIKSDGEVKKTYSTGHKMGVKNHQPRIKKKEKYSAKSQPKEKGRKKDAKHK